MRILFKDLGEQWSNRHWRALVCYHYNLKKNQKAEDIKTVNEIVMGFPGMKCGPKLMDEDLASITTGAVLDQACLFFSWIKL